MTPRRSTRDATGAVYMEFLIAFLPVFLTFLSLWQYGLVVMSRLVVEHAAVTGARAAAVIIAEAPSPGELTDKKKELVTNAVYVALAPLIVHRYLGQIEVHYPGEAGAAKAGDKLQYEPQPRKDPFDITAEGAEGMGTLDFVRVRIKADFVCRVVPVNVFVCGADLGTVTGIRAPRRALTAEAAFPYQGARYLPPGPPSGG